MTVVEGSVKTIEIQANAVYLGDNLSYLQAFADESIDLVYIDPPFNSNRVYEKADAQFSDKFASMTHYLDWIRPRIAHIFRILKPTGSFFLHCDKNASHYLKVLCDQIFSIENFRCDLVWIRTTHPHSVSGTFDTVSDSILYYSKSEKYKFYPAFKQYSDKERETFPYVEPETGRRFKHASLETGSNKGNKHEIRMIEGKTLKTELGWKWTQETLDQRLKENPHLIYWTKNGRARYKLYLDDFQGYRVHNVWDDIPPLDPNSRDYLYRTQKPVELLKRIIACSTDPGDLVVDCFCGSGTTLVAAQELGRRYIGIDESEKAVEIARTRLQTKQRKISDFIQSVKNA
jgi:DNA modification methylase